MKPTGEVGVYIHFPYCRARCPYCDFKVDVVREIPHRAYADAVLAELDRRADESLRDRRLASIYFGGGTPSLWEADEVARIIEAISGLFGQPLGALEVTLEANPSSTSASHLRALARAGVNRLSIGVQSFDDETLAFLGRWHSAARAHEALQCALDSDIAAVSFDLMCAVPEQSLDDWHAELAQADPYRDATHISVYELTFHRSTPLGRRLRSGRLKRPDEGLVADMLLATESWMAARGRDHYEVSNYAGPGHEAVHNSLYWHGGEYLGLGVGAHSMRVWGDHVERRENTRHTEAYLREPTGAGSTRETLGPEQHLRERLFLALRTRRGADLRALAAQLDVAIANETIDALDRCVERGWLERTDGRYWPTAQGLLFADSIAVAIW